MAHVSTKYIESSMWGKLCLDKPRKLVEHHTHFCSQILGGPFEFLLLNLPCAVR